MAYDRYVAICNPLLYTAVMSRGICIWLVFLSYFGGNMSSLVHTSFAFILKYCDRNVISHFFCDLPPLLKLSCTDTSLNEWLLSTYSSSVEIICFIVIIISYFYIFLSVLKIRSSNGRKKTFSTCASHLISVAIYQGTLLFIYSRPSYLYSPNTDKIISVFYTIIIPVLNPLIYSFRNKYVKDAAKRVLKPKLNPSWDIRFQNSSKSLITNSSCVYAQSCPALCDPMDYNLPGSFVLGIIQTRILEWVAISFSKSSLPTQGSNPGLPHCRQILYQLSYEGSLQHLLSLISFPFYKEKVFFIFHWSG